MSAQSINNQIELIDAKLFEINEKIKLLEKEKRELTGNQDYISAKTSEFPESLLVVSPFNILKGIGMLALDYLPFKRSA